MALSSEKIAPPSTAVANSVAAHRQFSLLEKWVGRTCPQKKPGLTYDALLESFGGVGEMLGSDIHAGG